MEFDACKNNFFTKFIFTIIIFLFYGVKNIPDSFFFFGCQVKCFICLVIKKRKMVSSRVIDLEALLPNKINDTFRTTKTNSLFYSIIYLARVSAENKKDNLLQDC